jgi:hypothetical protein
VDEEEAFLSRWSRRKLEAKRDAPAALPAAEPESNLPAAPDAAATQAPAAGAQPGTGPEYREFFDPRVDEKLRRTALKKLFSEPQFNVMDGLDTYIDDYSKPDPIPEAMLRRLNQAKDLLLFEQQKSDDAAVDASAAVPAETGSAVAAPDPAVTGPAVQDESAVAAARAAADSKND